MDLKKSYLQSQPSSCLASLDFNTTTEHRAPSSLLLIIFWYLNYHNLCRNLLQSQREALSDRSLAEHVRCGLSFQPLHTLLRAARVCAGGHSLMKPTGLSLSTLQLHLGILSM